MDDIGIDQWSLFGYGGGTAASTPNIEAIARAGIKFHNMWSMPACSNGRAALFTGRYPFRTNVLTALGSDDLANYMVNPNEITLPRLLKLRGYKSALFGKFHLGIQRTIRLPTIWCQRWVSTISTAGWTRPGTLRQLIPPPAMHGQ
jgi:arylsulfatase A-like enzyme